MKKFISRTQSLNWCQKIFVILLFSLVAFFSLNYSGFCFAQMRYLSNEEKIRLVFEYQNNRTKMPVETTDKGTQYYEQVKYKNFEEFVKMNPNCCQINPGGGYDTPPPDFLERITGFDAHDVIVTNFEMRYLDEKGNQKSRAIKFENTLQNCGAIMY